MGALFLIALLSVTATIYYSFAGMRQVIAESLAYGENQGHQLAKDSRKALRSRIETDLADSAEDQARIIGLIQENIAGAVNGVIDDVIAASDLRAVIASALSMLEGKRVTNLPKKHNNFPY